ncbi:hypothetical protein CEXT_34251 [Caerostris extrusa]|uniref:Uncharacterized protein n=1 Tax=Caerostris extrusa TaxID=172846 RepID=A0AAV4PK57_CAEEX|nr:hypothetical protein CEXT_34251 [Caerostris extrusa]
MNASLSPRQMSLATRGLLHCRKGAVVGDAVSAAHLCSPLQTYPTQVRCGGKGTHVRSATIDFGGKNPLEKKPRANYKTVPVDDIRLQKKNCRCILSWLGLTFGNSRCGLWSKTFRSTVKQTTPISDE